MVIKTPKILDGKRLSEKILSDLKEKIRKERIKANLAVILVGNNQASKIYVERKKKYCEEVGIGFRLTKFKEEELREEIIEKLRELNKDEEITGILIQLPLPKGFNSDEIINTISPKKDVDGLTTKNREELAKGNENLAPATPKGILRLMEEYGIGLEGKKVVLVGLGYLVGDPLSKMLKNRNVEFVPCDDQTENLKEETKKADVLISATGVPNLIKEDYIKKNAVVIDAGFSKINGKISGDVDFKKVKEKVSWIAPVPGGVGPMTIAMLIENIYKAYKSQFM